MKCMKCEQLVKHCIMFGCITPEMRTEEERKEQAAWWKSVTQ